MRSILLLLCSIFAILTAYGQDPWEMGAQMASGTKNVANTEVKSDAKLEFVIDNPGWMFEGVLPGQGKKLRFHEFIPDSNHARVPGDVFTDLWRIGRIEDMNMGQNPIKAKWVNDYEWWYFKQFNLPKEMENKRLTLRFDGVDYACDVYLNGEYLGSHEGMFDHFTFDVTKLVKYTTKDDVKDVNFLSIRLSPAPRTLGLVNGRKYRWHGDYNQNVVPTGIWQPVKIIATEQSRITDLYVRSDLQESGATVDVEIELNNSGAKQSVVAEITLTGDNFSSKDYVAKVSQNLKSGVNKIKQTISIPDAKLWWPWDLGDQNLYKASVVLRDAGGVVQDVESTIFGVREVRMEMNEGWNDGEVGRPWTVMINGKRHFVRSGTWGGPPDMFTGRTTEATYRELIRLAREANLNNLRIFNWHPVEIPLFYKLCNEAGITVWQDIGMINNNVVQEENIKQDAFASVVRSLKDRRNHPCNIIIEGSEEILFVAKSSVRNYNWKMVNELGDVLKDYTDLYYLPTSPLSDHNGIKVGEARHDSAHPHGVHYSVGNSFMEDYYPKQNYAVIPELAVTSCPDVESIRKFIPEDELWPPKPSWGYRWADLDVLQGHNYEVFGEDFTNGSMEEFVEATQVAQGVYFQYAMELYRTRKPKMSALCFCHFILNTPDFKWATVDYFLQPKESHYYIQRAYQPLLVTLQYDKRRWLPGSNFEGRLWIVNDFMSGCEDCTVEMRLFNDKREPIGKREYEIGGIEADCAKRVVDVTFAVPGQMGDKFYIEIELLGADGAVLSSNEYFLLVDDQALALECYKRYGVASKARKDAYGSATNRYFPGLFDNRKGLAVEWLDVK